MIFSYKVVRQEYPRTKSLSTIVARLLTVLAPNQYCAGVRDAYSNLLGEYVQAPEVGHDDIAGFQIVCPLCREDIFRVAKHMVARAHCQAFREKAGSSRLAMDLDFRSRSRKIIDHEGLRTPVWFRIR
jgi:hypothetical protein